jgi:hypothetical protein
MSATIAHPPAPINELTYLARVTTRDHRAIEEALAGATLLTESSQLAGVVIEAAYAAGDPPLLKRLREDGIARIVDPQSLRLTGSRFLEVDALSTLPYAPKAPLVLDDLPESRTRSLAREAMEFERSGQPARSGRPRQGAAQASATRPALTASPSRSCWASRRAARTTRCLAVTIPRS